MELNYIKQAIGQLSSGNNMIDQHKDHHTQDFFIKRDIKLSNILKKNYKHICLFGHFPLSIALTFKCKVTIIDNAKLLDYYKDEFKNLYNIDVILKDPLYEDIEEYIKDCDLIVYHDSEYKVPLELLRYKHMDKDVFIMNTFLFYTFKHNKNTVYSVDDLIQIYPMKEIYSSGKVYFVNDHFTYYVYGKIDD